MHRHYAYFTKNPKACGEKEINFLDRLKLAWEMPKYVKGSFERAFLKGLPTKRDEIKDPYREHAWVYACISVIMRKISSVPFVVASRQADSHGDLKELPEHPAALLLKNPNPVFTASELWQGSVLSLYLHGETLWLFEFLGQQQPQEIFIHNNPKDSEPLFEDTFGHQDVIPIGWSVPTEKGVAIPFSNEEVLRFRYLDSQDHLRGLSPTEPAELAISQDFKAATHNEALLTNQAVPSGFIEAGDLDPDEPEVKRLIKKWDSRHKGPSNKGKTAWLFGGMKFVAAGLSTKDLDFIEGRRFNREEILAVFGVPPAEVGVHEFSNYANASVQGRKFWNNTLIPLLVMIEEAMEMQYFQRHFSDVVGFFDLTNVEDLEENLDIKSDVAVKLASLGVPFAAINERLQMNFDTSLMPWLSEGVRGLSQVRVGTTQQPELEQDPNLSAPVQVFKPTLGVHPIFLKQASERRQAFRRNYDLMSVQHTQRMRERVRRYFENEQATVVTRTQANYTELVNRQQAAIQAANAKWAKIGGDRRNPKRGKAFAKFMAQEVKTLSGDIEDLIFSFDASTGTLTPIMESELPLILADGGNSVATLTGLTFDPTNPAAIDAISQRINSIVTFRNSGANIPQDSFEKIRESLTGSISRGESVTLAAGNISNVYDSFSDARALTIAQTEMGFAFNTGAFQLYEQEGIERHEWLTAGDNDVRDSHLAAEAGGPRKVGSRFPNGLLYPNDPAGAPEEVIHCRCTTAAVVEVSASLRYGISKRIRMARTVTGKRIHLRAA